MNDDGLLAYLDDKIMDAIDEKIRIETRLARLYNARESVRNGKPEQVADAMLDEYSAWKHMQPKERKA